MSVEVRLYLDGDVVSSSVDNPLGDGTTLVGRSFLRPEWVTEAPGLIVSDVDSTLIDEEVIDQLAELAGVGQQVAEITERAMQGHLDFETSLRERVSQLEGLPEQALREVYQGLTIRQGAADLVAWIHGLGGRIGVVSGGFTQIVGLLADKLTLDYFLANDLEIDHGRLTGRVVGPVVTAATKKDCLERWRVENDGWTLSLGDGANDIPLLQAADLGIAICAKPAARNAVPNYLDVPRLDAVIGLTGRRWPNTSVS